MADNWEMNHLLQRHAFELLLAGDNDEQAFQDFLEKNSRFIPREFVQNHGIAQSLVLRKLPFGPDYKSDLFYFSKSSDDWNAVFVELEKPQSRFFRGNSNIFHADFERALQQINQWKAWFLSDQNRGGFLSSVSALQVPAHMARNPTYFKYVLVFGRRAEYAGNEDRRRLINATETDNFKVITYDSLSEDLEHKFEVAIGSRHNQFIDILTDEIVSPTMYCWVEPTQLRVSAALHERLKNSTDSSARVLVNGTLVSALVRASNLVRVRS